MNVARGRISFASLPTDIERRFPLDAWNNASRWDLTGLDASALFYEAFFAEEGGQQRGNCPNPAGCGNWSLDIPRPQWGVWFGDTWRVSSRLTVNYGARYDLDLGAMAPPLVGETDVIIDNGLFTENVGYRNDIKDFNNVSPRAGFNYDVSGNGGLVIRGGAGLFYSTLHSNPTFDQQLWNGQRVLTNTFRNDGRPGFVRDPTRGITGEDVVSGRVPLPPQGVYLFNHDHQLPAAFQTVIGVQKQLGQSMSVDADLTHARNYDIQSSIDSNLFYDPATGYNKPLATFGRPRPDYGQLRYRSSDAKTEELKLATSFTRRFRDNWQAGLTYTLMLVGEATTSDNPFCRQCEWGLASDFQRHTFRANGIYQLPFDITVAGAYFYGSGNPYQGTWSWNPFGSGAGTRLRPDGSLIPRNNLQGESIHKVDIRATKEIALFGSVKLSGIAELFNVFNHANYGSYTGTENSVNYQKPVQNLATAYTPRSGQLAFKLSF